MRRVTGRLILVTGLVGFMLATSVSLAQAAFDQTPPSLAVPVRPAFVVGSVVDDYPIDTYWYAQNIAQSIRWSATDNVGVCGYDLYAVIAGGPPPPSWSSRRRRSSRGRTAPTTWTTSVGARMRPSVSA